MVPDPKTKPVSARDTTLSGQGEILRRVLFLGAIAALGGGAGCTIAGFRDHRLVLLAIGGALLATALGLWLLRRRWGAARVIEELQQNPFKPDRAPKD